MYTYGHWNCKFKIDLDKHVAFLYKLTCDDKVYIGVKKFYKGIFELPIGDAKESNWKTYTSSSKIVNRMISENKVFYFEILEVFVSYPDALSREHQILSENDVYNNSSFLNLSKGYTTDRNKLEESYSAISKSIKILWEDETYRNKTIDGQKGKIPWNKGLIYSDEHKLKLSQIGKELWNNEDYYNKNVRRSIIKDWFETLTDEEIENYKNDCRERSKNIPNFNKGYVMSDEHKKKLSDAKIGTTLSDSTKKKISQKLKGIQRTEEYKDKMREIKSKSTKRVVDYVEIDNIRYKSLRQAAIKLGINQDLLKKKCESNEYPSYIVIFKSEKDLKKNRIKKPQIDYIIINGEKYNSISEAANITGECRNSISKKLKSAEFTNYNAIYK